MKTDKKIITYNQAKIIVTKLKRAKKKIVMATGCFDLLHLGHLVFLNEAKTKGDILFVALGNDKNVKKLKGLNRPIFNERARAKLLASIEVVDYVIICNEKLIGNIEHKKLVEIIKPDIYICPKTDKNLKNKREMIKNDGGKLITCNRTPPIDFKNGISTTEITKKIEQQIKQLE